MKKTLSILLAITLVLGMAGLALAEAPNTELSGKLVVWSSGDELSRFVEGFNKVYPNIQVEITVIPNSDFLAKLEPAMASGQGAPDVFTGESDYVKYLVNTSLWDDLTKEPYSAGQYLDNIWDYVKSVGTDANGALKALSWQASPGSVIYRRDIAEKYLGTGDPAKVGEMLSSNEKMLEVAEKLKTGSNGAVKMFATWQDIFNMQFSNRAAPWVKEGKLVIDQSMVDFFDVAKSIADNGYDIHTDPWSAEWSAAVEGDEVFCYVLPTWGYQFLIKPSAVNTKGKWGLCQSPVPYVKGGTWLGVASNSQHKDLAWAFVEYVTCNTEALQAYASQYGEYVSNKAADEALAKEAGEEVLAGQNLYEFYNGQMAKIPGDCMTAYDQQINSAYLTTVKAYAYDGVSLEDALKQFKSDVLNAYPDLAVE
jgi:ABC-type glycerol-3-phosphate transport system substrate-binding protein